MGEYLSSTFLAIVWGASLGLWIFALVRAANKSDADYRVLGFSKGFVVVFVAVFPLVGSLIYLAWLDRRPPKHPG